jgi:hypothetical protein
MSLHIKPNIKNKIHFEKKKGQLHTASALEGRKQAKQIFLN